MYSDGVAFVNSKVVGLAPEFLASGWLIDCVMIFSYELNGKKVTYQVSRMIYLSFRQVTSREFSPPAPPLVCRNWNN
jgi:hypothetical protein